MSDTFNEMMANTQIVERQGIMSDTFNEMKHNYDKVEVVHKRYVTSLNNELAEIEKHCILKIHETYRECCLKYNTSVVLTKSAIMKQSTFKREKLKLTKFNGDLEEYSQVKSNFLKYVIPEVDNNKSRFILKSSLGTKPLDSVKKH